MGQAKQRGSFDQRQALAVERDKEIAKLRAAYEATRPKQRVSVTARHKRSVYGKWSRN